VVVFQEGVLLERVLLVQPVGQQDDRVSVVQRRGVLRPAVEIRLGPYAFDVGGVVQALFEKIDVLLIFVGALAVALLAGDQDDLLDPRFRLGGPEGAGQAEGDGNADGENRADRSPCHSHDVRLLSPSRHGSFPT